MNWRQTSAIVVAFGAAAGRVLLLGSCSSLPDAVVVPLEIPGAHYFGNQACRDCHADLVRKFPASPHAQVRFDNADRVTAALRYSFAQYTEPGGGNPNNFTANGIFATLDCQCRNPCRFGYWVCRC